MKLVNVKKAFVTGKVLEKIWKKIASLPHYIFIELPSRIRKKADKAIGLLVRPIWANSQKVIQNKIVFMTYDNKYTCNPKYIAEEIIRQKLPYELIWVVAPSGKIPVNDFPPELKLVRRNSYEDFEARATAKIWIENAVNFTWYPCVPKKKEQFYLNTWHGSMGLKRIGENDQKNKTWVKCAKQCTAITNYCISNSDFENNVFRSTYWPHTPILSYGHARNDILMSQDKEYLNQIKEKVLTKLKLLPAIPDEYSDLTEEEIQEIMNVRTNAWNTHYVLYAPTFRDNSKLDCYNIDFKRLIISLKNRFGGEWKVLMRYHFHNRKVGTKVKGGGLFINATGYPDMQELLSIVDIGITDYSSWICDFALTGRPGFIYAIDLDSYNNERGLYYPLETTPFPIATNNDELIDAVNNFDANLFEKRRQEFLADKGCIEDGQASKRVVEKIKEIIQGGEGA